MLLKGLSMKFNEVVYAYNNDDGDGFFLGGERSAKRYLVKFPLFTEEREGLTLFGYLAFDMHYSMQLILLGEEDELKDYLFHIPVYAKPRLHDCGNGWGMGYGICSECKSEVNYYLLEEK